MKKFLTYSYWAILLFYFGLLIDTVFIARDAKRSINLVPFDMIQTQGFSLNVYGNILMFVPLGIYAALLFKQDTFRKTLAIVIGASLFIEIVQFIFARGATDIDDVILNTAGGVIGIIIYLLFRLVFKTKEKIQNALTILSLIIGVPMVGLVIMLIFAN